MIASNDNSGRSYRMGARWKPHGSPWTGFAGTSMPHGARTEPKTGRWPTTKGKTVSLGDTHLSFSPDIIFNNIFSFNYKGFTASVQVASISASNISPTPTLELPHKMTTEGHRRKHDARRLFHHQPQRGIQLPPPRLGIKDATVGVTLYNVFSAKYDNNGWAAPSFKTDANGKLQAYTDPTTSMRGRLRTFGTIQRHGTSVDKLPKTSPDPQWSLAPRFPRRGQKPRRGVPGGRVSTKSPSL